VRAHRYFSASNFNKMTDLKILVIENDPEACVITEEILKNEGFKVHVSFDSEEGIRIAKSIFPDLILMELQISPQDGIDLCLELRNDYSLNNTLIVFYTGRDEDYSQIAALNAGADDYIIRPVRPRVLITRLKALIKRQLHSSDREMRKQVSGLTIDRERYLITKDGQQIVLPRKEFELLALLSTSPRKVFTRKEISQSIWGYEIFSKNRTIDVHIRKLREKLGEKYIKTIKGIGYSLEV
jgi:two-component system, OmpR family, alkaline phosphatase synthesis response regulator PhoP